MSSFRALPNGPARAAPAAPQRHDGRDDDTARLAYLLGRLGEDLHSLEPIFISGEFGSRNFSARELLLRVALEGVEAPAGHRRGAGGGSFSTCRFFCPTQLWQQRGRLKVGLILLDRGDNNGGDAATIDGRALEVDGDTSRCAAALAVLLPPFFFSESCTRLLSSANLGSLASSAFSSIFSISASASSAQ